MKYLAKACKIFHCVLDAVILPWSYLWLNETPFLIQNKLHSTVFNSRDIHSEKEVGCPHIWESLRKTKKGGKIWVISFKCHHIHLLKILIFAKKIFIYMDHKKISERSKKNWRRKKLHQRIITVYSCTWVMTIRRVIVFSCFLRAGVNNPSKNKKCGAPPSTKIYPT